MGEDFLNELAESLGRAIEAALKALLALILVLAILLARTLQAIFFLARPALLVGCVVAAGYTSITLFSTVLVHYGSDLPASLLALSSVVIIPAAFLVLKPDSGTWALMLAVAAIEFLAHLGIERAPPIILALLPVLALAGTTLYFLVHMDDVPESVPENTLGQKGNEDEQQKRNKCTLVDCDDELDNLHGDTVL